MGKKISVLVIAHNEEKYIVSCLESLLKQSFQPHEIVVVVHNSTDRTLQLAQKYPITVCDYQGPPTQIASRKKGFSLISGDYVLCIDGDSVAATNWVFEMTKALDRGNILVGSLTHYSGLIYLGFNFIRYFSCVSKNSRAVSNVWGPSFGFVKKHRRVLIEALNSYQQIHKEMGFNRLIDDIWMAHNMAQKGDIEVINKTRVIVNAKEKNLSEILARLRDNLINFDKFKTYIQTR